MRELLALTSRHLRATVRGRAARAGAALFVLALIAAVALPEASRGGGLALLAGLFVLALFASGFSVGAGTALPEDRVCGREGWLAALSPPGWQRRLAVVLSAWILAVTVGTLGGVVVAALAAVSRPGLTVRTHTDLPLPQDVVLTARADRVALALTQDADRPDIEIDVRPLYLLHTAPIERARIAWEGGAASGTVEISAHGPLTLRPPADATSLTLRLLTPGIRLRLGEARRLGAPHAPWIPLLWSGLLFGLFAGTVAPVGVLVSRVTTAQTASAAAFVLLLFGVAKHGLITLAGDLRPEGVMAVAPDLLRAAAWIAPEAPLLDLVAQAGALRAPGLAAAGPLGPALLYTVVAGVLACWPLPRGWVEGVNA